MIFCPDEIIPDSSLTGPNNIYIYIYIYIYTQPQHKVNFFKQNTIGLNSKTKVPSQSYYFIQNLEKKR